MKTGVVVQIGYETKNGGVVLLGKSRDPFLTEIVSHAIINELEAVRFDEEPLNQLVKQESEHFAHILESLSNEPTPKGKRAK